MPTWTPDERLTFDIAFALKKVAIPGFRKALTIGFRLPRLSHRTPETVPLGIFKTSGGGSMKKGTRSKVC